MKNNMDFIFKYHSICINQSDYPYINTIFNNMSSVRVRIDFEILKYGLSEKIFNNCNFRLNQKKRILYLSGFDINEDGFMIISSNPKSKSKLFAELLKLQEICSECLKSGLKRDYEAGKYIIIEPIVTRDIK